MNYYQNTTMKQNKQFEKSKEHEEFYDAEEYDEYEEYEDDVEVWQDYMSDELATGYHILTDWFKGQGIPILDNCTFHDFAYFCYCYSSGRKPEY